MVAETYSRVRAQDAAQCVKTLERLENQFPAALTAWTLAEGLSQVPPENRKAIEDFIRLKEKGKLAAN